MMVCMTVLKFKKQNQSSVTNHQAAKNNQIDDNHSAAVIYETQIQKYSKNFINDHLHTILGKSKTTHNSHKQTFPSFCDSIPSITKSEINSQDQQEKNEKIQLIKQTQLYSQMFVDALGPMNINQFTELITNRPNILQDIQPLITLISKIDPTLSIHLAQDDFNDQNVSMKKIQILYDWTMNQTNPSSDHYMNQLQERDSKINQLMDQITNYIFSKKTKIESRAQLIEEYCLKNILAYQQEDCTDVMGHAELYILNFVRSLLDAYQYEKFEPSFVKGPQDEKEDVLRQGAYYYLERALGGGVIVDKSRFANEKNQNYIEKIKLMQMEEESDEQERAQLGYANKILLEMTPEEQNNVLLGRLEMEMRKLSFMGTNQSVQMDSAVTREKRRRLFE
ncbi:hypothetical protein AKO1_006681 [Acrasis kona]|uniref:Uncharacterized protein n=1 Tax=Acrasis kona TaxID=1008807 RepID=A0AAW2ZN28_9EUKA